MFTAELAYRTTRLNESALRAARGHILLVDCSHGPQSVVSHGAGAFVRKVEKLRPDLRVEHLRLWDSEVRTEMEYNLDHVAAKIGSLAGTATSEDAARLAGVEAFAAQAATARALVVAAPLWNYGAPWILKQYFDCVLHPGLTFKEKPGAAPQGLLGNGRLLVLITSAGSAHSKDHLDPWLRDVAAMMGFDRATVVSAPNVAHGERQDILEAIGRDAEKAATEVASHAPRGATECAGEDAAEDAGLKTQGPSAELEDEADVAKLVGEDWKGEELLKWLREQGGLSEDALESLDAMRPTGAAWHEATEEDWRDEELGLDDSDVVRLCELQAMTKRQWEVAYARAGKVH